MKAFLHEITGSVSLLATANPITAALLAIVILLFGITIFFPVLGPNASSTYSKFPRVGKGLLEPWLKWQTATRFRLNECEAEGYAKYNKEGKPFTLTMYGLDNLVMPAKYLRALKETDRHVLNFAKSFGDVSTGCFFV